ncbi:MAG TPA: thioredoxin domain-containing protein [Acidimicrobiales bacterium]|jgi:thioredoxin 1|nr:thioredoxin domain-containing protein [Acidimicrobiales bacterium]
MTMLTITENVLDETLAGDLPVLVAFTAEWCGPCHMYAPVLEELATERRESLRVVALDSDDNLEAARRFEVMSVPTVIVFIDGQPVRRLVGARPKSRLARDVDEALDGQLGAVATAN